MVKYLFKVIIVFLIIFNFIVPVVYYSCTVAVILCALYYLFFKRSIPFTYFGYRYIFIILVFTFFMAVINLSITVLYGHFNIVGLKRLIVQGYMLCCLIFALPVLIEEKAKAFEDAILIICGAFALQGFIHTLGFLIAPVGDFLFSLQPERLQDMANDPARNVDRFRFYAITGSPFFELPAAYGVACIMFFRMQLMPDQNYLRGWKAFVIMLLMIMGISLSGRTGFIGFGLGLSLYVIFNWNDFSQMWRNVVKITGGFLLVLIIFFIALTPAQKDSIANKLLPFAFEAYYNWRGTGRISTASSDVLEYHYYLIDSETMLWGRGGGSDDNVGFTHTDAGYMNDIIYGGIFYFLLLAVYQFLYFRQPMKVSREQNSRAGDIDFFCFLLLLAHMFILEYKATSVGTIHIVEVLLLYIGFTYLIKRYALEDMRAHVDFDRSGEITE